MKTKYEVRFQGASTLKASSIEQALSFVRKITNANRVYRVTVPDGIYCYASLADLRKDQTGASALAVICKPE